MLTHFTAKERAFVDALKADTGRDLGAWMMAIRASGVTGRNDVIDWLRQQGFTFANAAWLERIHHNDGKLIYAAGAEVRANATKDPRSPTPAFAQCKAGTGDIEALLAAGKAYRPLAQLILNELLSACTGAAAGPMGGQIAVGARRTYAALLPTAKDARLMLALGEDTFPGWERAKQSGAVLEPFRELTHMKVFSDARQIDADLKHLIRLSVRNCTP